jgi:hypothetical protein
MSLRRFQIFLALAALVSAAAFGSAASAAVIVIDDFNVDEGHFNLAPNFSGSTTNVAATSTADRITTGSFEGAGNEQLVLNATTAGSATRLRFLSGGGTPANNLALPVAGAGPTDGWIGLAVKTESPDWNVQIWLEGPENNGSVPKNIIADGQWHIYQWNLDDESGGADGWGAVAGIVAGDADVQAGNYTIDSVLFRHAAAPANATIFMDWVVRDTEGQITAPVIPEPASIVLVGLAGVALALRRRRSA